jgi:hypothetical protein
MKSSWTGFFEILLDFVFLINLKDKWEVHKSLNWRNIDL